MFGPYDDPQGSSALERLRAFLAGVPENAVKDLRGERRQVQIAAKSGLTQGQLSELETGRRRLTADLARRLAPALGTTPQELEAKQALAELRGTLKQTPVDLEEFARKFVFINERLPDTAEANEVRRVMVEAFQEEVARFNEAPVAMKGKRRESTRDAMGRRKDKPYKPKY